LEGDQEGFERAMTLVTLNGLPTEMAVANLLECCYSRVWAERLLVHRPFGSPQELIELASQVWFSLPELDWLEAFAAHPRIGDLAVLREKFSITASLEQGQVEEASDSLLLQLADLNRAYLDKFGFIFIVFATGKSAATMLALLQERIDNNRPQELHNNAREQDKITALRISRRFSEDQGRG